jgi:DNA-binding CsgD family transcriptional regulator/PAS domain-containing protein
MTSNTGSSPCLSHELMTAIYQNVQGDNSWNRALSLLGAAVDSHTLSLRLLFERCGARREGREVIVAASPDRGEENTRRWEEECALALLPPHLGVGEAQVSHWTDDPDPRSFAVKIRRELHLDWTVSVCIELHDDTRCVLQCHRAEAQGTFSEAEVELIRAAGEHFGRAIGLRRSLISARVVSEFQAEALNRMGIGGVLIQPSGGIVALNEAAEAILERRDGLSVANHKLVATERRNDVQLQRAIKAALDGSLPRGRSRGFSLNRLSGKRPLGVVVNTRSCRSVITNEQQNCALVFVRQPELLTTEDTQLMQQMFGFTPAEARLGMWLANGMRLEEVESILKIRHNTARAHLRSMYCKTEVNRQSELIQLLASCAAPLGRGGNALGRLQ